MIQSSNLPLIGGALLALGATVVAVVGYVFLPSYLRERDLRETARILIHDLKFGGRVTDRAVKYGDAIIPLIRRESLDFTDLNTRNAFWIPDVLGRIDSELARQTLAELYGRDDDLTRLVGAIGLARQGLLTDVSWLIGIVARNFDAEWIEEVAELAIIALGHARDPDGLPPLIWMLNRRAIDYWLHAESCEAVARIGSPEAVPVLRICLRDVTFYAIPYAFLALIALGDREAVPLAIERIVPEIKRRNDSLIVRELENVTGMRFGYDRDAWRAWWLKAGAEWHILPAFLRTPGG